MVKIQREKNHKKKRTLEITMDIYEEGKKKNSPRMKILFKRERPLDL